MFTKTIAAMALALFLGTTAAAGAQGWQGDNGFYQDRYGLGYSNSARHDPTNTNGKSTRNSQRASDPSDWQTWPPNKANDVPWAPF
jgi:hypothetical protein